MITNGEVLSARAHASRMPARLRREFRSSHAGEMGAVFIYVGILCGSFDRQVRAFAKEHLRTEYKHLMLFEDIIHFYRGSLILPLWVVAGFLTGFIPAIFGRRVVFRTIETVETFVSEHYQAQIEMVGSDPKWAYLQPMLVACKEDEEAHRDDAGARYSEAPGFFSSLWLSAVAKGSEIAVAIAKRV